MPPWVSSFLIIAATMRESSACFVCSLLHRASAMDDSTASIPVTSNHCAIHEADLVQSSAWFAPDELKDLII